MIRDPGSNALPHIALGSAQLGLAYGINGTESVPSIEECFALLELAWEQGVRRIDTAPAYGLAEQRIGQFIDERKLAGELEVCTKLPPLKPGGQTITRQVEENVTASLTALKVDRIDCYLLHHAADLNEHARELVDALMAQQALGRIARVGISVYTPDELIQLRQFPELTAVQLPTSVLDQRFLPHLRNSSLTGIEVQIRSVFLQGLMTLAPSSLPESLADAREPLKALKSLCNTHHVDITDLALGYVMGLPADFVVVGVNDPEQLTNNMERAKRPVNGEFNTMLERQFAGLPTSVTDPRNW